MSLEQANILDDWRGTDQGAQLKTTGTEHWNDPNEATNASGFSALPIGFSRSNEQDFQGIGDFTTFWTSTHYSTDAAIYRMLSHDETRVYRTTGYEPNGTPVCQRLI